MTSICILIAPPLADNGTIHMWDWRTGYNFQRIHAAVQPGSLDSESGIFACVFDHSESRLITAEADKTIKVYKEDDSAVSFAAVVKYPVNVGIPVYTRLAESDNPVFFLSDGRKPPGQLEARNPQEKEILMVHVCSSCRSNYFLSTKSPHWSINLDVIDRSWPVLF